MLWIGLDITIVIDAAFGPDKAGGNYNQSEYHGNPGAVVFWIDIAHDHKQ